MSVKYSSMTRIFAMFFLLIVASAALGLASGHDGKRFAGRLQRLIGIDRVVDPSSAGSAQAAWWPPRRR